MIISSGLLIQSSSHQIASSTETKTAADAWTDSPLPPEGARVTLSPTARNLAVNGESEPTSSSSWMPPELELLRLLIERMTGHKIRIFNVDEFQVLASNLTSSSGNTFNQPNESSRVGRGISLNIEQTETTAETTSLSANGEVTTVDGRVIHINLHLTMARTESTTVSMTLSAGDRKRQDPLVINLTTDATSLQDGHLDFDLNSDGKSAPLATLASGSAYLAMDLNHNGRIDNGKELFGPQTGGGFNELAALDQDKNGWIDANDSGFAQLLAWLPSKSGGGSLTSLGRLGIGALSTTSTATPFELRGRDHSDQGAIAATGLYLDESGRVGTVQEVDLSV